MTARRIPEVNDFIIDFLHDDKLALLACSLTSRTFTERSWYHLFCTIVITDEDRMKQFAQSAHGLALRHYVRELVVGRSRGRRPAHVQQPLLLDTRTLLDALSGLPNLKPQNVTIRGVRWSPIVIVPSSSTAPVSGTSPSNYAYIPSPIEPPSSDTEKAQKTVFVLPVDPLIRDVAGRQLELQSTFRIVEVNALPFSVGGTATAGAAGTHNGLTSVGEVVLHIHNPSSLRPVDNSQLVVAMRDASSVTIRWSPPIDFVLFNARDVVRQLRLSSSTSMRSIALWTALFPSRAFAALQQWAANLTLLQEIPADHIARIIVGILVDREHPCEDALEQVKQVRWGALLGVLGRFPSLRRLEVAVVEKERLVEDEIWGVLSNQLEGVRSMGNGVRLVRTEARIL